VGSFADKWHLGEIVVSIKGKGWARLYWHTSEQNKTARALYDSYVESDGHIRYRISF
jgi:hypothetical protein